MTPKKKRLRPRGSGTYQKRGRGSYRLLVSDPDGGPRRARTVRARNDEEARKLLAEFVGEVLAGKVAENAGTLTVRHASDEWLERRRELAAAGRLADATLAHNEWAIGHVVRRIGGKRLRKLEKPAPVEDLYADLAAELGPKSVKEVGSALSQVLEYARRRDWIRVNGARDVAGEARPRVSDKPIEAPEDADVDALLAHMQEVDFRYFALTILAAAAGGSRHEILGVQRRDIDLTDGHVWFRRGVTKRRTGGTGDRLIISDRLKTSARRRRVAIGDGTVAVLRELLVRLDDQARAFGLEVYPDDGFLFSPDAGGERPLMPDSVSKHFRKLCEQAGVALTPHALRHYAATVVAPHLTETEMMGRFGWKTSAMVRRYADYREAKDREAAAHADRIVIPLRMPVQRRHA